MLASLRNKRNNNDKEVVALTRLVTGYTSIEKFEWREQGNWTEMSLFRRLNLLNISHCNDLSKHISQVSAETSLPLYSLCSNHNDPLSVPQPQKLYVILGLFHIHFLCLECSLHPNPSNRVPKLDEISHCTDIVCVSVMLKYIGMKKNTLYSITLGTLQLLNMCLLNKQSNSNCESLLSLCIS